MGRIFHLGGQRAGLNVAGEGGRFSLGGRGTSAVVQDPYAAHVARLQGIDGSGGYFTARDYTMSLSQAGLFVDAFGVPAYQVSGGSQDGIYTLRDGLCAGKQFCNLLGQPTDNPDSQEGNYSLAWTGYFWAIGDSGAAALYISTDDVPTPDLCTTWYDAATNQPVALSVAATTYRFAYTSPNVQASPTRVVDAGSRLVYVSADGGDDTAIGSAVQTVAAYTCLIRSPQPTWNIGGAIMDVYPRSGNQRAGALNYQQGTTDFNQYGLPRGVRRNGVVLAPNYDLAPITSWQVITVYCSYADLVRYYGLFGSGDGMVRLHLAALRTWPTDPSTSVVAQTEAELASYYAPLLAAQGSN